MYRICIKNGDYAIFKLKYFKMKTYKKIGLTLILALTFAAALSFVGDKTALAIKIGDDTFRNAQYNITALEDGKPKTITVVIAGEQFTFTDKNTSDNDINLKTDGNDRFICGQSGTAGITLDGPTQPLPGGGVAYPGSITLNYKFNTDEKCNGNATDFLPKSAIAALYGVPGTPSAGGGGGNTTPATDTANSDTPCEKNSGGWSFAWAACPVLDAASGLTNMLLGLFEDQLSFSVGQLGGIKDPDSGAFKIHKSWALMRDIATALLVVAMLVMVFSQAASFGPFDAYTVRKMLPKLVAAVILIQISWVGVSWVIDLVNAVAKGLADLMYYPFGGAGNMDIWNLLANAKLSDVLLTSLNWATVGVFIALGVAFLFTMLGVAFVAITALFFAVLTLVFRKILLIMLLIFVPLALLAWILPGTERYWKMWRENFLKALFMFPIAVAIIASGRIFAYVVGTQDNSQFLNLIFILVGFFGPLFILPKTFKWGGQAMSLAGNGLMKASGKVSERPKKFLDKRQEGWAAERRRQSEERVAAGTGFNPKAPWRLPIDKFRSGQWDPTLGMPRTPLTPEGSRRREAQVAAFKKAGRDTYNEDLAAARIGEQIDWERMIEGDGVVKDDYLQDVLEDKHSVYPPEHEKAGQLKEYKTFDGRIMNPRGKTRMQKLAALYEMEKLGGATNNRHILKAWEDAKAAGPQTQKYGDFRRFMSDSVGTMLPKLTDIYKGTDSTADAGPGGVAQQHGSEVENMLATLTHRVKMETNPVKRNRHIKTLNTYLDSYLSAAENDNLRGGIEMGSTRAVKALVTTDGHLQREILKSIHNDPEDGRVTLGLKPILTEADVVGTIKPQLRARLDAIIQPAGGFVDAKTIRESAEAGSPGSRPSPDTTGPPAATAPSAPASGAAPAAAPLGVAPPARGSSTGPGPGGGETIVNLHPTAGTQGTGGGTEAAEAMRQAAAAMTEASENIRRSAVAQAQTARRLGPIINQASQPGDVVSPNNQEGEDNT